MDDFDYLAQVYQEARLVVGASTQEKLPLGKLKAFWAEMPNLSYHAQEESQITDKLLKGGSCLPSPAQELSQEEYWKGSDEKYKTAAWFLLLCLGVLITLQAFGCSTIWS